MVSILYSSRLNGSICETYAMETDASPTLVENISFFNKEKRACSRSQSLIKYAHALSEICDSCRIGYTR